MQSTGYLKYDERLKILGLTRLENRRVRSDFNQSINQSINLFCHTQTQLAVISIANTFRLCVTGSTQGAYAPHKRATHVQ